jgi:hypothetical protein
MLANFEQVGVRFQYPENWTLDSQTAEHGGREITVYSPGGSYWSVAVYDVKTQPQAIIDSVLEAMHREYEELDHEEIDDQIAGRDDTGVEMNFYYMDLTSTAIARVYEGVWANYLVLYQAEDREYKQFEQLFRAITTSFLQESNLRGEQPSELEYGVDAGEDDEELE